MDENTKVELSWDTSEYTHVKKSIDWYWILGIIAVAAFVSAIIFHDTLFGILILLSAGMLAYLSTKPSSDLSVHITDRGIFVNDIYYPYKKIKNFWVDADTYMLLITTDRFFMPIVNIPIEGVAPADVRLALRNYSKEEEIHESSAHKFMESLGF